MSSLSCETNAPCCVFTEPNVYKKLARIAADCDRALTGEPFAIPMESARDIEAHTAPAFVPRPGLQSVQGQVRLLHDLANIELQAMELGLRTLIEFPNSPIEFREALRAIVLEESEHLRLCLELITDIGGKWGEWPIHRGLWAAASQSDTLLERVFVVHRYLESSGLDAGDRLLARLSAVHDKRIERVVRRIVTDEVGHVAFGSKWYFQLCEKYNVDASSFFRECTQILMAQHPRKENVSRVLREKAGYSKWEIDELIRLRVESLARA